MKHREWLPCILLIVLAAAIGVSGCTAMKVKFTRKKKKEKETPVFYFDKGFAVPSYVDAYRQSYTLWKAWEGELITALDGVSRKRKMACYLSALEDLKKMRDTMREETHKNITPYIAELEKIGTAISKGSLSGIQVERVKRNVERHKMIVEKRLSPHNAESWLKEDKP